MYVHRGWDPEQGKHVYWRSSELDLRGNSYDGGTEFSKIENRTVLYSEQVASDGLPTMGFSFDIDLDDSKERGGGINPDVRLPSDFKYEHEWGMEPVPPWVNIYGEVIDGDGDPMGGVTVEARGELTYSGVTDQDGLYYIEGIEPGDYTLEAVSSSGVSNRLSVTLEAETVDEFNFGVIGEGDSEEDYTFTTAGSTGRDGPTQTDIDSEYSGTNLEGNVIVSGDGIQEWTAPETSEYQLICLGSQGGVGSREGDGGLGAYVLGDFQLSQGENLKIVVGQKGADDISDTPSGGGASFVALDGSNEPLVVAGAGGAFGVGDTTEYQSLSHASTGVNGENGFGETASADGGIDGDGGDVVGDRAGSGAGWETDGGDGSSSGSGGQSLSTTALGGAGSEQDGGFGGGGATDSSTSWGATAGGGGYSGGGGGYSGGTSEESAGGGGGSFVSDNALYDNVTGEFNAGDGLVVIRKMV